MLLLTATAAMAAPSDGHEMCESWAESGECTSNPEYMQRECAAACKNAGKYKSQMQKECEGYAAAGECGRNPAFMLSTCRKECDRWEEAKGLKIDRKAQCVEWSLTGKCDADPVRMAQDCNTSCTIAQRCARSTFTGWSIGTCDKALRCEVEDKRSNCAELAARGECRENPTWMAQNCLVSCSAVDVDSVLAAQRAEFRTILSPLIDIPGDVTRRQERCWLPGWAGQNHYKQMLPVQCAAPRRLPWQRRRVPRARLRSSPLDQITCPVDVQTQTPRVMRRSGWRIVPSPPGLAPAPPPAHPAHGVGLGSSRVWRLPRGRSPDLMAASHGVYRRYRTRNVTLLPHTPHVVRVQQVGARQGPRRHRRRRRRCRPRHRHHRRRPLHRRHRRRLPATSHDLARRSPDLAAAGAGVAARAAAARLHHRRGGR